MLFRPIIQEVMYMLYDQKININAAFKQPVVIGNSYNGVAEILKGLNAGDKVISAGYQELIDGEYVRF